MMSLPVPKYWFIDLIDVRVEKCNGDFLEKGVEKEKILWHTLSSR